MGANKYSKYDCTHLNHVPNYLNILFFFFLNESALRSVDFIYLLF